MLVSVNINDIHVCNGDAGVFCGGSNRLLKCYFHEVSLIEDQMLSLAKILRPILIK
jgi:hypothetical protein